MLLFDFVGSLIAFRSNVWPKKREQRNYCVKRWINISPMLDRFTLESNNNAMKHKILHTLHIDYTRIYWIVMILFELGWVEFNWMYEKCMWTRSRSECVRACVYVYVRECTFITHLFTISLFCSVCRLTVCVRAAILLTLDTQANPNTYINPVSHGRACIHTHGIHSHAHTSCQWDISKTRLTYTPQSQRKIEKNMTMFNLSSMKNPSALLCRRYTGLMFEFLSVYVLLQSSFLRYSSCWVCWCCYCRCMSHQVRYELFELLALLSITSTKQFRSGLLKRKLYKK